VTLNVGDRVKATGVVIWYGHIRDDVGTVTEVRPADKFDFPYVVRWDNNVDFPVLPHLDSELEVVE